MEIEIAKKTREMNSRMNQLKLMQRIKTLDVEYQNLLEQRKGVFEEEGSGL